MTWIVALGVAQLIIWVSFVSSGGVFLHQYTLIVLAGLTNVMFKFWHNGVWNEIQKAPHEWARRVRIAALLLAVPCASMANVAFMNWADWPVRTASIVVGLATAGFAITEWLNVNRAVREASRPSSGRL